LADFGYNAVSKPTPVIFIIGDFENSRHMIISTAVQRLEVDGASDLLLFGKRIRVNVGF
jgi:hypothetical protein